MDKVKTIYDYSVDEVYNQFCIINEAAKSIEGDIVFDGIYKGVDKEVIFFYAFIAIIDYGIDIINITKQEVKEYLDLCAKVDKLPDADRIKVISEFIIDRNARQLEKIKEESDMKFKDIIINLDVSSSCDKNCYEDFNAKINKILNIKK